ncbi:hypothetical protein CMO89_03290 [Candidatus Woesearchaeota archaeon]|nr:hypothetical protein [Candidatus Woesearchaeota archaeon]|tara:strand:- start:616 stop:855 length:240 start_codon:yes stop_codon:yes gene_type:complete
MAKKRGEFKVKKRLTQSEEFEIMKLVLDKFLWLGFGVMAFGLYQVFIASSQIGFTWIVVGVVVLVLFMMLIVREYEIIK